VNFDGMLPPSVNAALVIASAAAKTVLTISAS
jgi:hypothetical protein